MRLLRLSFLLLLGGVGRVAAGDLKQVDDTTAAAAATVSATEPEKSLHMSYEMEADYSYVGRSSTEDFHNRNGLVTEQNTSERLVLEPQWNDGPIYRFGLAYQQFSFGLGPNSPVPNTLQSLSAVVGVDFQIFNSWLVRIEAQPGIYGDFRDARANDFDVPVEIGGSYIANSNLQWVLALSVDPYRQYPVLPVIGVRWTFHDQWTLNAVLPTPRLEYAARPNLTLYVGGDLKDGAFRVDEDFGDSHNRHRLNSAILEYDEVRVGAGANWKVTTGVNLELEGGCLPYRQFNYYRANTSFTNNGIAPYGQVSISTKF